MDKELIKNRAIDALQHMNEIALMGQKNFLIGFNVMSDLQFIITEIEKEESEDKNKEKEDKKT